MSGILFHIPDSVIPIGGIDVNTLLMLHMDGANGGSVFTDSSLTPHTVTVNGATTDTTEKAIGTASGQFQLSNTEYITVPDHADWYLDGDFTIDSWVRVPDFTYTKPFISQWTDDGNRWSVNLEWSAGTAFMLRIAAKVGSVQTTDVRSDPGYIALDTWCHVAAVRHGNNFYTFIDGVDRTASGSPDSDAFPNCTDALQIGQLKYGGAGLTYFDGHLDELRVSNVARWTTGFTPNTEPYDEG